MVEWSRVPNSCPMDFKGIPVMVRTTGRHLPCLRWSRPFGGSDIPEPRLMVRATFSLMMRSTGHGTGWLSLRMSRMAFCAG